MVRQLPITKGVNDKKTVYPTGFESTLLLFDIFKRDDESLLNFLGNDIYRRMEELINN